MLRLASLLLLVGALVSCELLTNKDDNSPIDGPLLLETDASAYAKDAQPEITITNVTTTTIYYNTCMPTSLEALNGDELVGTLHYAVCECLCITELLPGESWTAQIPLDWNGGQQDFPGFRDDLTYRFRLAFYEDDQLQNPFSDELVVTNTFRVQP